MKIYRYNIILPQQELLMDIFEDGRDIVTFDFDDTLQEKTGIFQNRFRIFETLAKSGEYQIFILTSRNGKIGDIVEFVEKTKLPINGIISNVDMKGDFLRNIAICLEDQKIICHFEDDIDASNDCVENDIPCFLTAESINDYYLDAWKETITQNGEMEFYEKFGKVKKSLNKKENAK